MATGRANDIPVVGGNTHSWVIQPSYNGFFLLVVDLRFFDFADTHSADLLGVQESELDLSDLEPLTHSLDIVQHLLRLYYNESILQALVSPAIRIEDSFWLSGKVQVSNFEVAVMSSL